MSRARLPFALVEHQVEKMFRKAIEELPKAGRPSESKAEDDSARIRAFIEATGWSVDEYVAHMMGWKNLN